VGTWIGFTSEGCQLGASQGARHDGSPHPIGGIIRVRNIFFLNVARCQRCRDILSEQRRPVRLTSMIPSESSKASDSISGTGATFMGTHGQRSHLVG